MTADGKAGQADALEARLAQLSPRQRRAFELLVERGARADDGPIPPRPRDAGPLPLSFAQQRLWFLDQLVPGGTMYNIPSITRLPGPIDAAVLARSLTEIVRRHEVLRTTFSVHDGQPVQVIHPPAPLPLPLPLHDLRALPASARTAAAAQLAAAEAQRPFDLRTGPLLRAHLVRLDEAEYALVLVMHHIVTDGWSMGIFFRELGALYPAFAAGQPSPLPPLPLQYADVARWQRAQLTGPRLAAQLAYWRQQLAELPVLRLPTDHPRPAVPRFEGRARPLTLPAALVGR
ncbi:MAG TPA: condensation domain-containing protein, partial [Gemmatimonadaceae bacterium]|nr:condensation domain-containing protein [Gemmatimonadaceae bacterium]